MQKDRRQICTPEKANKVAGETEFIFTGQITGMQMLNTSKNKSKSGSVTAKCPDLKREVGLWYGRRGTLGVLQILFQIVPI